jgi:hypothetical protein
VRQGAIRADFTSAKKRRHAIERVPRIAAIFGASRVICSTSGQGRQGSNRRPSVLETASTPFRQTNRAPVPLPLPLRNPSADAPAAAPGSAVSDRDRSLLLDPAAQILVADALEQLGVICPHVGPDHPDDRLVAVGAGHVAALAVDELRSMTSVP